MPEQPAEQPHEPHVENRLSGQAHVNGPMIQAGAIHGDVTVHASQEQRPDVPVLVSAEPFRTSNTLYQWEGSDGMWTAGAGVKALVEGLSTQAVVLKRMRPVVLSRKPPRPAHVAGVIMSILERRGFTTDLDADPPVLTPRGSTAPDFPFTVTSSDPELFEIFPTSTFEVEWCLELEWTSAGRSGRTIVDRDGQPFRYLPEPRSEGHSPSWDERVFRRRRYGSGSRDPRDS